ncbi:peroxiredoxin [Acidovorax sp. SDU_ACID1]|uniref:peroxiredoxin n=1 Tax=Acidovorax sp. SDU_ACID1 TaxID=3136632 RepID=UPI003873BED2
MTPRRARDDRGARKLNQAWGEVRAFLASACNTQMASVVGSIATNSIHITMNTSNHSRLPSDLPKPVDDGAARHLEGLHLPSVILASSDGTSIDLGSLKGRWVIYVYPMTGRPGAPLPDGWNDVPGARGCTSQSCSFRDHHKELLGLDVGVLGLSAQASDEQCEAKDRLHLPFELLCDASLKLKQALRLPTFAIDGIELYKRLTFITEDDRISKVFYPVFPPDRNADEVLSWLHNNTTRSA